MGVPSPPLGGPYERIVESRTMIIANKAEVPAREPTNPSVLTLGTSGGHRWMGVSALAIAVFLVIEAVTKLTMGGRPELDDSTALLE